MEHEVQSQYMVDCNWIIISFLSCKRSQTPEITSNYLSPGGSTLGRPGWILFGEVPQSFEGRGECRVFMLTQLLLNYLKLSAYLFAYKAFR